MYLCVRILYDHWGKISVCGSLVQDLCVRISCARSLCQDVRIRILQGRLCKISVCGSRARSLCQDSVGPLVQDLCVRISCPRSLCQDLCAKIQGHLCYYLCIRILYRTTCRRSPSRLHKRNFPCVPQDQHARSWQRVARLENQKTQLYQNSSPWTRTISAEGYAWKPENATLPAFGAINTHDPRRWLRFEIRKCNFTSILRPRRARSPQRVHYHVSDVLRLPQNHERTSYEMLHCPHKMSLKLKFQECNPSQELSPWTSKHRIHGADFLRLPTFWQRTKHCACHGFHKVPDSLHLPRKLTFLTSTCDMFLAAAMQNEVHVRKHARTPGKTMHSKLQFPRRKLRASLRSRNQHRISKRYSCADETRG